MSLWPKPELDKLIYEDNHQSQGGGIWGDDEVGGWERVAPTGEAAPVAWDPERQQNDLQARWQIAMEINGRQGFPHPLYRVQPVSVW